MSFNVELDPKLQNLKDVLFGQQKQSNALNETCTRMIYRMLTSQGYVLDGTYEKVIEELSRYAQDVINGKHRPSEIFEMICGRTAVLIVEQNIPCQFSTSPLSDESTKIIFSVTAVGADVKDAPLPASKPIPVTENVTTVVDGEGHYLSIANRLRDKIVPTVPQAAKDELGNNDYAIALSCVPAYFGIDNY